MYNSTGGRFVALLLFEKLYQTLNSISKHLEVGYKPAKFNLLPRVNSEGRTWPISRAFAQLFVVILVMRQIGDRIRLHSVPFSL